jgi:hypothetical protein
MIFRAQIRMDTEHPCFIALLECLASRPCETLIHVPATNAARYLRDMELELLSTLSGVERGVLREGNLTVEQQLRVDQARQVLKDSMIRMDPAASS